MKQRTKPKILRLYLLVASLCLFGVAVGLALYASQSRIVYFFSPTDIAAGPPETGRVVRLGGLVEMGSAQRFGDGATISFNITDLKNTVSVSYRGVLPDLFREGQGVVVQGSAGSDGTFTATEVLAKHDETYMPPEVAKALKESGRWQEGQNGQSVNGQSAEGEQIGDTTPAMRSTAEATTETNP
ncbi:MAG TPA: cytochrome c maturation protein CcmE [Dongiaceae bacterium]|jgi:cytochrome c-type biogenesis protein CcmE|nr:cytochrome c maturation protein CcmE [Dongiaceae bacterium]